VRCRSYNANDVSAPRIVSFDLIVKSIRKSSFRWKFMLYIAIVTHLVITNTWNVDIIKCVIRLRVTISKGPTR